MATINDAVREDVEDAITADDLDHSGSDSVEDEIAAIEDARADAEEDMNDEDGDDEPSDEDVAETRAALYLTQTDAVNKIIAQYPSDSGSQELDDPKYDESLWNLNAKILQAVKSFNRAYKNVQNAIESRGAYIGNLEYNRRVAALGDTLGWSITMISDNQFRIYGPGDEPGDEPVDKGTLPAEMVATVATMYIGQEHGCSQGRTEAYSYPQGQGQRL